MNPASPQAQLARSQDYFEATLRSETRRAFAIIGVVGLILALVLSEHSWKNVDGRLLFAAIGGMVLLITLQLISLLLVSRARRLARPIPVWFIVMSLVLESLLPAGIMSANIFSGVLPPYASLVSPPLLANGLMVIFTALRLRPSLCIIAGTIASAAYGSLVLYTIYGLGIPHPTTGLPSVAYLSHTVFIFACGIAAAWVAHEIRTHFTAALREADTRREMARIEQDLAVARSIQQALLPRAAPNIPGYEVAGWNRPADQTGGDYYDWQSLPDGNWIVTLADVSGHGIGPAMVTAACRAYVRASTAHPPHGDLPALTSRINRLLAEDLPEGRFITMASIILNPRGGPITLLSAGHGPIVLVVGSTGEVRDIIPSDLPLAIAPDISFGPAQSIELNPGDVLALVTDGFVEWSRFTAAGDRQQFGLDNLRASLRRHAALPLSAMIEAITADVAAFAGAEPQQDDLTMVLIRRA